MDYKLSESSYFISFEGIEGSGKTTQIKSLAEYLKNKGYNVTCLREPGGTKFGEKLREAILESETPLHPLSEALLFASSRTQLLSQMIIPKLKEEKNIVILDRYIDSSIAYQGFARGLGMNKVQEIHSSAPLNIFPDLTLYLKIDLETSMKRQDQRGNVKDYFEKENKAFYENLIDGYNECHKSFPQRIKAIDATKSQEVVTRSVLKIVEEVIK